MRQILLLALLVCGWAEADLTAHAQAGSDEAAIRAAIHVQADAWNRADIPAFMAAYEHSAETTFIGATIGKGYDRILERYQKNYTTAEQMGTLTFHDVEVRMLPGSCGKPEFAAISSSFHTRSAPQLVRAGL